MRTASLFDADTASYTGTIEVLGVIFRAMGAADVAVDSLLFRADVREVAVTRLTEAGDELTIDFWNESAGVRSITRK